MRRKAVYPWFFLFLLLLLILGSPQTLIDSLRYGCMRGISPLWTFVHSFSKESYADKYQRKIEDLQREKQQLEMQLEQVRSWLLQEEKIEEIFSRIRACDLPEKEEHRDFFQKRQKQLSRLAAWQMQAIPAKVIYRDSSCWSSFLWVGVGEVDNARLGCAVIAKNSPVVVGAALVGIVEEVGYTRSKIRLLTDAHLIPAVRVARGGGKNRVIARKAEDLLYLLEEREDLFSSASEKETILSSLYAWSARLSNSMTDIYLAKGELQGSVCPMGRLHRGLLKGCGFNYDFPDAEGPARDLRTGMPIGSGKLFSALSLLEIGDLLVTSGMDGLFPVGLEVAVVSQVERLTEGQSSYQIQARMLVENIEDLTWVSILPAIDNNIFESLIEKPTYYR